MRLIDTDGVGVVCRSVSICLLVTTVSQKRGWTDRDAIHDVDSGEPKEPWGPDGASCDGAVLRGEVAAHCEVLGFSTVSCGTRTEMGYRYGLATIDMYRKVDELDSHLTQYGPGLVLPPCHPTVWMSQTGQDEQRTAR